MRKFFFSIFVLVQIVVHTKAQDLNEPWMQGHAHRRNSTLAKKNKVIAPYTALQVVGNTISLLGRKIELDKNGFPKQIQTFFNTETTDYSTTPNNLLAENIHFHFVRKADGKNTVLKEKGIQFLKKNGGIVQWTSKNANDSLVMEVTGTLEFDGFLAYRVKVTALQDVELKEVTMHIPFQKTAAAYMMGLGITAGLRPEKVEWKWDNVTHNQSEVWLGNANAGLRYSLGDERKTSLLPTSWGNENKGGITVAIKGSSMLANNYTGERKMSKGDVLYYNFTLLITPLHLLSK